MQHSQSLLVRPSRSPCLYSLLHGLAMWLARTDYLRLVPHPSNLFKSTHSCDPCTQHVKRAMQGSFVLFWLLGLINVQLICVVVQP